MIAPTPDVWHCWAMQKANDICAALSGAKFDQPFGPDTITYRLHGKLFALWRVGGPMGGDGITLKASDAEQAAFLMDIGVAKPAPYLKRGGWMLIPWENFQDDEDLKDRITTSYWVIRKSLTKKLQATL